MLKIPRADGVGRGVASPGGRGGRWQTRLDTTPAAPGLTPEAVPAGDPAVPRPRCLLTRSLRTRAEHLPPPTSHRPWFLADPRKPAQNRVRATASVTMATAKPSLSPVLRSRLSAHPPAASPADAAPLRGRCQGQVHRLLRAGFQLGPGGAGHVSAGTPENGFLF